jgi:hypothetical protein
MTHKQELTRNSIAAAKIAVAHLEGSNEGGNSASVRSALINMQKAMCAVQTLERLAAGLPEPKKGE